jgi:hypothetical protein
MKESEKTNVKRYEWMALKLNRDAYAQQTKDEKRLKQFIPCRKAMIFTYAIGLRPVPVDQVVLHEAAIEICVCHSNMGLAELEDLYRQAIKENGGLKELRGKK